MSVLELIAPQPTDGSARGFWSSVREALRGSHQDYTQGNLNRAILLLAIPMVLEMVLESLFAVTDVFWVGRLGANAVATVGITESMLALVISIGFGLALSTTAMVARRIGEKDPEDAAIAAVQAVVLGLTISLADRGSGGDLCAGVAAPDGSITRDCCGRCGVRAHCAGRLRSDRHAVPEQRDLPGCWRCGDCDAAAVGIEHHQPGS